MIIWRKKGTLQASAVLETTSIDNAKARVLSKENIRNVKEESLSQIENSNKVHELRRRISNWPKSMKAKEVIGSDYFRADGIRIEV